jgi:hypothetical protein
VYLISGLALKAAVSPAQASPDSNADGLAQRVPTVPEKYKDNPAVHAILNKLRAGFGD